MNSCEKMCYIAVLTVAVAVPAVWGAAGFGAEDTLDAKAVLAEVRASQAPTAPKMVPVSFAAGTQVDACAETPGLRKTKFELHFAPKSGEAPLDLEFAYVSCSPVGYRHPGDLPAYPSRIYKSKGTSGYALAVGAQEVNGVALLRLQQDQDSGYLNAAEFPSIPLSKLAAAGEIELGEVTITDWHARNGDRTWSEYKGTATLKFKIVR
jgi:hypothetical protein